MKKLFTLITFMLCTLCFAENVNLKFKMIDKTVETRTVDSEIEIYTFVWTDFPNKEIVSMEGFEQLKNLSRLFFYHPNYYGNWNFLKNIPNLKIFASDIKKSSLKFIENLTELESLELDVSYNDEEFEILKNTKINLEKLTKLKKIYLIITNEKDPNKYRLDFIPKFINVKNKPELLIFDNRIESISKDEIKLLKQYSRVCLDYNPIAKNKTELLKLKKAEINFSACYYDEKTKSSIKVEL